MRTTNKQFVKQVRNHIYENLPQEKDAETELQEVREGFNHWYGKEERKRYPNEQRALIEWLQGLPSEFNVSFTNYDIYMNLKTWFENCGEEYKEQDDNKEGQQYFHLVSRELLKMM